ncbi:MAG: glycoside hydrolase family 3 C-terminal domain-containing protein, partial [Candidatus Hodarchaeota archaeon]
DVVILFSVLTLEHETEGFYLKTIELPESHIELIKEVKNINPKTILVLSNGSAISMLQWINDVPAVIEAYLLGQAGGGAIADVLFGKENPSGKLAETFPIRLEHNPAYLNYPGEAGKVRYGEGLYVGYRYYDKKEIEPMFPFGFGLSYTTFSYSNLTVSKESFKDAEGVTVNVDITNTGEVPGKEIVQLYVHQSNPKLDRPYKELKGFSKLELQPNETKTATFHLDSRTFAYYSINHNSWIWESGEYDILIGASSKDIRLNTTVTLESTQELSSILNMDSTVSDWINDPKGEPIIDEIIAQRVNFLKSQNPDLEIDEKQVKEEFLSPAIQDMPLVRIFKFAEKYLPMPAEDLVKLLLTRVKG